MQNEAIIVRNLRKVYPLYQNSREKIADFFFPGSVRNQLYALRNVSFSVERGQSIALIGLNGSGKSTLANIIAGASAPTGGSVRVRGRVSMTAVSGGLNTFLTGEENIIQKCLLLGFGSDEIKALMPQIIEFSELGSLIKQPAKTYSSGMRAKLAFAISANIDPDIMVIDEALSVGDPTFTNKCLEKMRSFREKGKTIVFVSHSMAQVRDFCDRALWLEGGKIRQIGDCKEVTESYSAFVKEFNAMPADQQKEYKETIRRKQQREGLYERNESK